MVLLLFAGAYKRQVHIPLPDAAQAAVTILRGDESAWNGEVAEERCLVWSCRIPLIFSSRTAGSCICLFVLWKRENFKVFTYLSESRKWWVRLIFGIIIKVPKRSYPHPSEDTTRVISRSASKMATDRSACASTSRPTNAGEVKSALAVSYETEASLFFSFGFPYVSAWCFDLNFMFDSWQSHYIYITLHYYNLS